MTRFLPVGLLGATLLLGASHASEPARQAKPAETSQATEPRPDAAALARARADVLARYEQARQACQQRFAVVDCQDRVRAERDAALAPLREQALVQEAAERQRRAEVQRQRVEARQLEFAQQHAQQLSRELLQRPRPVPVAPSSPAVPRPAASAFAGEASSARALAPAVGGDSNRSEVSTALSERQAADRARELKQRRERAQAHRQQVIERKAAREAQHPPAAPLPLPSKAELAASAAPSGR